MIKLATEDYESQISAFVTVSRLAALLERCNNGYNVDESHIIPLATVHDRMYY